MQEEYGEDFRIEFPYVSHYLGMGRGEMPGLIEVPVKDEDDLAWELRFWGEDINDLVGVLMDRKESMDDKIDAANDILKILPKVYVGARASKSKKRKASKLGMPPKRRLTLEIREIIEIE